MYVWELVSDRLRVEGWDVWHSSRHDSYGPIYTVHLRRPGQSYEATGPTLTEAYAAAARRAREAPVASRASAGPRCARGASPVRV
jgi:hypothetical protein